MAEETQEGSRFEPLSALWRLLAAPQTLLISLGVLVLTLVLGTLIPQIPPEAQNEPQAWLVVQGGLLRQRGGILAALGLYDLYHAFWFRLLIAWIGMVLFVRTLDSVELAWRAAGRKAWTAAALGSWGDRPPQIHLTFSLPLNEARARLSEVLDRYGYWSADAAGSPTPGLVVGRRSAGLWARPLGYGTFLLALIGLAITGTWGWQSEQWRPVPGESRAVGYGTPYAVRLEAFDMQLGADQRLEDYASRVTWLEGDVEVGQDVIGVGRPVTRRGVTVRQIGYVPVVRMRASDADGQPLALDTGADILSVTGEAEIRFPAPEFQPLILVSERDLILALTFEPMCATGQPVLYIDRIQNDGAGRQALGALSESGSVAVDGLGLEIELTYVPILRVDQRPAMSLVVLGMAFVVIALLMAWIAQSSLVWIVVGQDGESQTQVQLLGLPGAGTLRWLAQLAGRLREGLTDVA